MHTSDMRVLVVDDDPALRSAVERILRFEGYEVATVDSGEAALELLLATPPEADLVVLDLGLPDIDGVDVARRLRAAGSLIPILMLTARGDVPHRVAGLDAGADDYLPKPFDLSELVARVRALARRLRRVDDGMGSSATSLHLADLELDPGSRIVSRGGIPIELTRTEFELLLALMQRCGTVVPRGVLLEQVWGFDSPTLDSNLDTYVSYVRRKIEVGDKPRLLHTVRGVGFVMREQPVN